MLAGRGAHFLQFCRGALCLIASRVLANHRAEFADGGGLLAKFRQAKSFPHSRGSRLEAFRIIIDHLVIGVQSVLKLILHERYFAQVELGIRCQIGLSVKLEVILKFLRRQIVMLAVDVPQPIRIKHIGGGGRHAPEAPPEIRGLLAPAQP